MQVDFEDELKMHAEKAKEEMPVLPSMDLNEVLDADQSYKIAAWELHSAKKRRSAPSWSAPVEMWITITAPSYCSKPGPKKAGIGARETNP